MPYLYSPRRFAESVAIIRRYADEHQRALDGFRWIQHLYVAIDDDPRAARETAVEQLSRAYGAGVAPMVDKIAAHGDAETVATRIESYAAAGADEFVFVPLTAGRWDETLVTIFRDVVPLLRKSPTAA
jgi:alkanesulfonate monooxygenase SsuD/methylene tetrahydromethanopterin reductase-like flavin-dependent oxidoreductase (luciferase family)